MRRGLGSPAWRGRWSGMQVRWRRVLTTVVASSVLPMLAAGAALSGWPLASGAHALELTPEPTRPDAAGQEAAGQEAAEPGAAPLAVQVSWEPSHPQPGSEATLTMVLRIQPGWHIDGHELAPPAGTRVELELPPELHPTSDFQWPAARVRPADGGVDAYEYHAGEIAIQRRVAIHYGASGALVVRGTVHFQAATGATRNPPTQLPFQSSVTLAPSLPADLSQAGMAAADAPVLFTGTGAFEVQPGSAFTLEFRAELHPGWSILGLTQDVRHGQPLRLKVLSDGLLPAGPPTETTPRVRRHGEADLRLHTGTATFRLPLQAPPDQPAGRFDAEVVLLYEALLTGPDGEITTRRAPEQVRFKLPVWLAEPPRRNIHSLPEALGPASSATAFGPTGAGQDSGGPGSGAQPSGTASTGKEAAAGEAAAGQLPADLVQRHGGGLNDRLTITVRGAVDLAPGAQFTLPVEFVIEPGWHIYGMRLSTEVGTPTTIRVLSAGALRAAGAVREPPPKTVQDPHLGTLLEHAGKVTFQVPLEVPSDATPGRHEVVLEVGYMACDATTCLPPETVTLRVPCFVGPATAAASPAPLDGAGGTAGPPWQQTLENEAKVVSVTVHGARGVPAGSAFDLRVVAVVQPGWQLYSVRNIGIGIDTSIEPRASRPAGLRRATGAIREPTPKEKVENDQREQVHAGTVEFRVPMETPAALAPGLYALPVSFYGQVCSDTTCVEAPLEFEVAVEIVAGGTDSGMQEAARRWADAVTLTGSLTPVEVQAGGQVEVQLEGRVSEGVQIPAIVDAAQDLSRQGVLGIVLLGILGALAALITPCVYPMIPITISVFAKRAEDKHTNVPLLAAIFCGGIIVTFTGIGLVLSVTLGEAGANFMATNWLVNLLIGALFLWFAGSLFGYYNIQLPSWMTERVTSAGSSGGVASVILMGTVFSITTFTCVGPIVSTLLALAAQGGAWLATVGMVAFSATFAIPFFLLALFPRALSGLPRSGGWLGTVKIMLAFVEVAAAWKFFCFVPLYFGPNLLYRELVLFIWGGTFLVAVLYLLGKVRFPHDVLPERIRPGRWGLIGATLLVAGYCFYGATGHYLHPSLDAQLTEPHPWFASRMHSGIGWRKISKDYPADLDVTLAELRGTGKPVFINFTGHT